MNEELRALQSEGLDVQLAFDGQQLPEWPARWAEVDIETCRQGHGRARSETRAVGKGEDSSTLPSTLRSS